MAIILVNKSLPLVAYKVIFIKIYQHSKTTSILFSADTFFGTFIFMFGEHVLPFSKN